MMKGFLRPRADPCLLPLLLSSRYKMLVFIKPPTNDVLFIPDNIPGHDMIVTTERIMNFAVDLDFVKPNFLERQIVQKKEEDKAKAEAKHKVNIM